MWPPLNADKQDRTSAGRLALVEIVGLFVAAFCGLVGYLFAPRDAFFGEQNSAITRVIGVGALLAGSMAATAGPLYAAWARRSTAWLCLAVAIAVGAFAAAILAAT